MSSRTVAMMLWNSCENDSRVIKEATSLASAGYDVTVVCLAAPHLPDLETRDGVTYRRVARTLTPVRVRVDRMLTLAGSIVVGMVGVLLGAVVVLAVLAVLAAAWWYTNRMHPPMLFVAEAVVFFALGYWTRRVRPRVLRLRLRRLARRLRRTRRRLVRSMFRPFRSRLLSTLYRFLTFRLVHVAMARTVLDLEPAVIHAHDLQTLPAAARLAKALDAKLVYDSHELALNVSKPPIKPLKWWMRGVERRAIREADRVITVSEGIAKKLSRRYHVQRPTVVHNAPPVLGSESHGRDVRHDLGFDDRTPIVLYVGAPSFYRGLEVLIDAMVLLPEFHLACVGPRNEEWETELLERAGETDVQQRIHFLDPVPITKLLGYLSTADVGVIAYQNVCLNHEFCMPNKLFETVLAGVPLVVAKLRDLRRFVEEHEVGIAADETDPAAIAQAVREVSADDRLRPRGERLERLREEFGWEAQGRRLVALYEDLVPIGAAVPAPRVATEKGL